MGATIGSGFGAMRFVGGKIQKAIDAGDKRLKAKWKK